MTLTRQILYKKTGRTTNLPSCSSDALLLAHLMCTYRVLLDLPKLPEKHGKNISKSKCVQFSSAISLSC